MGVLGEGRVRWTLAVLLGCVMLLVLAPTPLAAQAAGGTGKIEGKVIQAVGEAAIEGIEVCAFVASNVQEEPSGCATTGMDGSYAISELSGDEYDVEFAVPPGSRLYYITQYYKDKSSLTTAEPVKILEGETTKGINAELQEGGKISGTVTEFPASGHVPLQNIEVSAYEVGGSKLPVAHAKTNASGQYTSAVLAPGAYEVEFSPTPESGLNFVTQYYKNTSWRAKAEPVAVTKEETTEEVNAELRVGGEISGTVTDAWTHAPVSKAYVVAVGLGGGFAGVAYTNASGEYTIPGLATGEYKITFVDFSYIVQYYNDQPSMASANPVMADEGSATLGINAALVSKAPVNTAAPIVLGTPAVGQTLSCSTGMWTGEPTPTYTYA
ncbi:MAG: carboxypeptidase-like regulatory domain-containing protein, partial [Candidatus Korobacteraceae bacterium]